MALFFQQKKLFSLFMLAFQSPLAVLEGQASAQGKCVLVQRRRTAACVQRRLCLGNQGAAYLPTIASAPLSLGMSAFWGTAAWFPGERRQRRRRVGRVGVW